MLLDDSVLRIGKHNLVDVLCKIDSGRRSIHFGLFL